MSVFDTNGMQFFLNKLNTHSSQIYYVLQLQNAVDLLFSNDCYKLKFIRECFDDMRRGKGGSAQNRENNRAQQ